MTGSQVGAQAVSGERLLTGMRIHATVSAAVLASVLLLGCAAAPRPLEIGVTDDGFVVSGKTFKTRAELTAAIRALGATECRVEPTPATAYRQVASAVLAMQETGCHSGIIGSAGP